MKKVVILSVLTLCCSMAMAQTGADACVGTWLTGSKKGHVQIYKQGDRYFGKLAWLRDPNDPDTNKPKLDKQNPDAAKKTRPLLGLVNLSGFKFVSNNLWEDGKIYDPENGKEYSCKMTLDGNKLNVRGFIGISLIGRTDVWTKVK